MRLFESFKKRVREQNPKKTIGTLRRHLMPWYSSHSIVGKASRFSAFLDNWVGQAKEDASHIMDSDVTEGYYTLNSHDIAKSRSEGEKFSMIVSAIRILGEGSLLDTKEVYERWSATPNTYSIYRYDLSDTLHCLLVQKSTAYDPPRWLTYIFSSVESEQDFLDGFRDWFWNECAGAAYFIALQEGIGYVLAPEKQGQYGDTKHIGEGGPDELFTYWRDFSSNDFPLSLLLIGAPGTGKSSSVRQMAKDNKLFFARIDPQLLQTSLVNYPGLKAEA